MRINDIAAITGVKGGNGGMAPGGMGGASELMANINRTVANIKSMLEMARQVSGNPPPAPPPHISPPPLPKAIPQVPAAVTVNPADALTSLLSAIDKAGYGGVKVGEILGTVEHMTINDIRGMLK